MASILARSSSATSSRSAAGGFGSTPRADRRCSGRSRGCRSITTAVRCGFRPATTARSSRPGWTTRRSTGSSASSGKRRTPRGRGGEPMAAPGVVRFAPLTRGWTGCPGCPLETWSVPRTRGGGPLQHEGHSFSVHGCHHRRQRSHVLSRAPSRSVRRIHAIPCSVIHWYGYGSHRESSRASTGSIPGAADSGPESLQVRPRHLDRGPARASTPTRSRGSARPGGSSAAALVGRRAVRSARAGPSASRAGPRSCTGGRRARARPSPTTSRACANRRRTVAASSRCSSRRCP